MQITFLSTTIGRIAAASLCSLTIIFALPNTLYAQSETKPINPTPLQSNDGTASESESDAKPNPGESQAVRHKHYNLNKKRLGLKGYDPVAYFPSDNGRQGKPTKGKKSLSYTHRGTVYYFANQANLDKFEKDPYRYEPAYGGWCAYAMGNDGDKTDIDPKTFEIHDGRLYVFYNGFWGNTLPPWKDNRSVLKPDADKNWAAIIKK